MPKILDQVKNRIVECAKKRLFKEGVNHFSLRDIASDCEIAVGTIYNYFKNKEMLIATIMLEDWLKILNNLENKIHKTISIEEGFLCIYHSIKEFVSIYENIWKQSKNSIHTTSSYHNLLQTQIKEKVDIVLTKFSYEKDKNMNLILSETILTCAIHSEINEEEFIYFIQRLYK